ncbi:MAG: rhodanese-like domain-containing protein [Kiritimatiellia bacterium]|jgi:phage shock protein E
MNNLLLAIVIAVIIAFFVFQGGAGADMEPHEVWRAVDEGALLIDVRTAGEFESGHLKGALNIPYQQADLLQQAAGEDKSRSVVVYCRSGRRSSIAKKSLNEAGYTNVINGGAFSRLKASRGE